MVDAIETLFPGLAATAYRITSPATDAYNCVAWAIGETDAWWWPGDDTALTYWPTGVPRQETLAAFHAALATAGFVDCTGDQMEPGFEKIALFADGQGHPTHAARQLADGRWSSKLGMHEDIEHELRALEGTEYGTVVQIMKRTVRVV